MAALGDLATLYRQASVLYLEKAAAEAQLKPTADYYLGAAHADAGNVERSLQATGAFLSVSPVPPRYQDRARARYATGQYLLGRRGEAMAVWEELAQRQPADPSCWRRSSSDARRRRLIAPRSSHGRCARSRPVKGRRHVR